MLFLSVTDVKNPTSGLTCILRSHCMAGVEGGVELLSHKNIFPRLNQLKSDVCCHPRILASLVYI